MSSDAMPERSALAAELALGLLEGADRASALRLVLSDPGFAAEVDGWRARMAPLYDGFADVAPPSGLMARIDQAIDAEAAADQVTTLMPAPRAQGGWKIATFAASAVAAMLALALVWPSPQSPGPAPQDKADVAVAQLTGPIDGLLLTARYDSSTSEMLVRVEGMPVTETEPELWIVPADGQPRRLGRLLRGGVTRIAIPEGHRKFIDPVSELILTMEPKVLPDPDKPSAPTVAQGRLQRI
ncbi:anti-sigma factor [Blastomonas fulva]|uniref:anti-sigma factor n=1 Tax=Blastomonas fulva TaxID=1550728 RepID=UPI0025A40C61|nr:anti-sigma factor [Blastomonas fulva]MDM7929580.1 anti-sigma factor [Blastomonas fulva]MDM7967387.1 anti-sigma factor [Blastomonas fulva]